MATTTTVNVGQEATPLPTTLDPRRTSVLVENQGPDDIWVGHTPSVGVGTSHKIATGTARTFGGGPLWGISATAQSGGLGDTTVVTEYP